MDQGSRSRLLLVSLMGGAAAFCAYFAMYAFRKPFAAAGYDDVSGWAWALDYKVALVIAQVIGYALSKLLGVKLMAEQGRRGRAMAILGLIALSWIALVGFAVTPAPWNVLALFLNGLPLGLIWGLVFSYLEGRRTSELMGAILCASFIVSSGVVKTAGRWLMDQGVGEFWMPAATGALFAPLLLVAVIGLSRLPPPSPADEAARMPRAPMGRNARRALVRDYGPGLLLLILAYVVFTAFRDFRDNFAAEIWSALGYGADASVFTAAELPVGAAALCGLACLMMIRDNVRAVLVMHGLVGAGSALVGLSTLAHQLGLVSPLVWMIANGAGLYVAYTPFNAMLFDRLIAAARRVGTAGFLIYLADASGYLGSVALLVGRALFAPDLPWLKFFEGAALTVGVVGCVLTLGSAVYFARRLNAAAESMPAPAPLQVCAAPDPGGLKPASRLRG